MYIASVSGRVCRRCLFFWTFVDRQMSERRINHRAGVRPPSTDIFFFPQPPLPSEANRIPGRVPSLPFLRRSNEAFQVSSVCDVTQGAPCIRSGCILLRGDPRQSHRGNVIIAQSASRVLLLLLLQLLLLQTRRTQSVPRRVSRAMHRMPLTNDD